MSTLNQTRKMQVENSNAQFGKATPTILQTNQNNLNMNAVKIIGKAVLPDQLTLQGIVAFGGGTNSLIMDDACNLNVSFGINTGAGTQALDVVGSATINNLREFLKTFVGVIEFVNYDSDVPNQLNNDITFNDVSLKGDQATYKVSVAASRRNSQFDQGLQTVYINGEFALTDTTSIGIPTSDVTNPTRTIDVTIKFSEWIATCEYMRRANFGGGNGSGTCK